MLLEKHLQKFTIVELEVIADELFILDQPKSKSDKIKQIKALLLNKDYLINLLGCMNKNDFETFRSHALIESKDTDIASDIRFWALFHIENNGTIKLCDDIKELYQDIDINNVANIQPRRNAVYESIILSNYLYAATPMNIFKKVLKSCFDLKLSNEQILEEINQITNYFKICLYHDDCIVVPELITGYQMLINSNKPYFIPKKEHLKQFNDYEFIIDANTYEECESIFAAFMDYEPYIAISFLMDEFHYGDKLSDAITKLNEQFDLNFTKENAPELIEGIVKLYNNTKRIENHGYSPYELKMQTKAN